MALLFIIVLGLSLFAQTTERAVDGVPDEVSLRIIVVSSTEQAQRIVAHLRAGEDFAEIARAHSIDSTANEGGYLGVVSRSMLRPELRDALTGMGAGQISAVTKTPLGYAILKIEPRAKADVPKTVPMGGTPATMSTGSVKDVLSLSGLGEAELGFNTMPKPPGWDQDPVEICEIRKAATSEEETAIKKYLDELNSGKHPEASDLDKLSAYFALGEIASYQGQADIAVERYKAVREVVQEHIPQARAQMNEALGIAYLHKSEMDNDIYRQPGDRCLLPMLPTSKYLKPNDSESAVQYFLKYLDEKPDDLEVQWLLNLAYMTLGEYPDKVPPKYLIPPSVFESSEHVGA
jgi:tetratricopeptide (TPR) repeat protein